MTAAEDALAVGETAAVGWQCEKDARAAVEAERDSLRDQLDTARAAIDELMDGVLATESLVVSLRDQRDQALYREGCGLARAEAAEQALRGGAGLIAAERQRQVEAEGWTPEHDDAHDEGDLAKAATCYAYGRADIIINGVYVWPWENKWWKPAPRVRELTKAGALIAAEIDRLARAALASREGRTT